MTQIKTEPEMNPTIAPALAAYYQAPTRDEISLCAYLAWEKAGRPADGADRFWNEAELQLRAQRQLAAEAAAAKANRQWPPARIVATAPAKLKKLASSERKTALGKRKTTAK
ncbi:MAG: hypothetical protein RL380_35 [Verrucomicrobiota bacterium]|jgi:hypothetical protein